MNIDYFKYFTHEYVQLFTLNAADIRERCIGMVIWAVMFGMLCFVCYVLYVMFCMIRIIVLSLSSRLSILDYQNPCFNVGT